MVHNVPIRVSWMHLHHLPRSVLVGQRSLNPIGSVTRISAWLQCPPNPLEENRDPIQTTYNNQMKKRQTLNQPLFSYLPCSNTTFHVSLVAHRSGNSEYPAYQRHYFQAASAYWSIVALWSRVVRKYVCTLNLVCAVHSRLFPIFSGVLLEFPQYVQSFRQTVSLLLFECAAVRHRCN